MDTVNIFGNVVEEEEEKSAFSDLLDTVIDMLKLIKQRWVIFTLIIAVFAAGAFGYSVYSYGEFYRATATFSITPLVSADSSNSVSAYEFNYTASFADQLAATFPYIAQSGNLRDVIASDLGGYINGSISAEALTNTNVFKVTVTSSSPDDAVAILDSFIENFPKISDYIIGDTRLNMIYQSGNPTKPVNAPDHIKHGFYGLLAGLLLNIVIFFLMALNKETVKSKADVAQKLNSKCICEVPLVAEKQGGRSKNTLIRMGTKRPAFTESMRALKKRVLEGLAENDKIIGITSSVKNEGKTTVAFNLSQVLVTGGDKVLLLDLNMRNTDLQRFMLKEPNINNGVANFLKGEVAARDTVYSYKKDFDIIFCGDEINRLDGLKIMSLLEEMREIYDYIIVDMPSCELGADVSVVSDMCDDLLFNISYDKISVKNIKNAFRNVLYSKARFLGFILNSSSQSSSGYYHSYGKYNGYRYRNYRNYGHYTSD